MKTPGCDVECATNEPVRLLEQDQPCLSICRLLLHADRSELHIHDGLELGAVISGSGFLVYADRHFAMAVGDVYFVDCMTPHGHRCRNAGGIEVLSAHIRSESIESLAPVDRFHEIIRPFCLVKAGVLTPVLRTSAEAFENLSSALAQYRSHDAFGYFSAWTFIIRAVIDISRQTRAAEELDPDLGVRNRSRIVNRAIDLIREKYREDLTLEQIATHCSISVSGLSRLFSVHMRTSPIRFRNRLRINHAIFMLRTTNYTIEHVAYDCGFKDVTSFRRLFLHIARASPGSVRENGAQEWRMLSAYS